MLVGLKVNNNRRLETDLFADFVINFKILIPIKVFQFRRRIDEALKPLGTNIYEPGTFGKYLFYSNEVYNPWIFCQYRRRKKFQIGGYVEFYKYNEDKGITYVRNQYPI
ncbi:MAG: hypothetical protein U0T85_08590 [Cloacibacterium normanense]